MTKQNINIGTNANDGTGDTLRTAFGKASNNFNELYNNVSNVTSNLANLITVVDTTDGDLLFLTSSSFDTANAAYDYANLILASAQAATQVANTVNAAFANAKAAYDFANGVNTTFTSYYNTTNTAINLILNLGNIANTINAILAVVDSNASAGFDQANSSYERATIAWQQGNTGTLLAIGARTNAAAAFGMTNVAFTFANGVSSNTTSAYRVANSSYDVTNVAYGAANAGFFKTNSAYGIANAAYDRANTKVNTVNGVITGTFSVQGSQKIQNGNLVIQNGTLSVISNSNQIDIIDGVIYINGVALDTTPPGSVIYFAATTPPSGYLKADGSAVSRSAYSRLFSAIGTTWGVGNGSTTFNLPDLRGEFIRGFDDGRGLDSGRVFSAVQTSALLNHTHTYNDLYGLQDDNPGLGSIYDIYGNKVEYYQDDVDMNNDEDGDRGAAYYTGRTAATGGSENRPRNQTLLVCIKF
jgi:microcystin-dependent protein